MREIRKSGSEGAVRFYSSFLPLSLGREIRRSGAAFAGGHRR